MKLLEYKKERGFIVPNRRIRFRLRELLYDKKMTQTELSKITGVRQATISNMKNGVYETINVENLLFLMDGLQVNSFDEILEVVYVELEFDEKQ